MKYTPGTIKGNEREVPGDLPPMLWWEMVNEYADDPETINLPWYHPLLEYLNPHEIKMTRAKARVWWEVTNEPAKDISCWWEVRQARKRGDVPLSDSVAVSYRDAEGIVHCGKCKARWSMRPENKQWSFCKLCGQRWEVIDIAQVEEAPQDAIRPLQSRLGPFGKTINIGKRN